MAIELQFFPINYFHYFADITIGDIATALSAVGIFLTLWFYLRQNQQFIKEKRGIYYTEKLNNDYSDLENILLNIDFILKRLHPNGTPTIRRMIIEFIRSIDHINPNDLLLEHQEMIYLLICRLYGLIIVTKGDIGSTGNNDDKNITNLIIKNFKKWEKGIKHDNINHRLTENDEIFIQAFKDKYKEEYFDRFPCLVLGLKYKVLYDLEVKNEIDRMRLNHLIKEECKRIGAKEVDEYIKTFRYFYKKNRQN